MLLKNKSARLITINGTGKDEKYQIKCGNNPAVDVPDALCKSAFVKALLKDGSLAPHVELDEDDDDEPELDEDDEPELDEDDEPELDEDDEPELDEDDEPELDEDDGESKPKSKAELIAECEMLGIETNSRDTVKSLTEKLEAFNQ